MTYGESSYSDCHLSITCVITSHHTEIHTTQPYNNSLHRNTRYVVVTVCLVMKTCKSIRRVINSSSSNNNNNENKNSSKSEVCGVDVVVMSLWREHSKNSPVLFQYWWICVSTNYEAAAAAAVDLRPSQLICAVSPHGGAAVAYMYHIFRVCSILFKSIYQTRKKLMWSA